MDPKNNITRKIKRSGMFEFLYISSILLVSYISSRIKIFILRLRLFDIDWTADIAARVIFFQSSKHSVKIGKHVTLGSGVVLKAGFNGKIILEDRVSIHENSMVFSHMTLRIGKGTMIAPNCFITDFDHIFSQHGYEKNLLKKEGYLDETTQIGKNVWIGANSVILKGVIVGDNTIIGAGSVVTKSVPALSIAVGNPAKVIKKIKK